MQLKQCNQSATTVKSVTLPLLIALHVATIGVFCVASTKFSYPHLSGVSPWVRELAVGRSITSMRYVQVSALQYMRTNSGKTLSTMLRVSVILSIFAVALSWARSSGSAAAC